MINSPLLFSIRSYRYLRDRINEHCQFELGEIEVKSFPDGERYQRIMSRVDERHVVLLGGTVTDSDTLELYDLACAMVKHGAQSLTLLVPYYAYSTMERSLYPGEVVTAKTRARLLSSIPLALSGNRIVMMDLHSEAMSYYFEGGIVPTHLTARPVVTQACQDLAGSDFVLASTDAGRAKWVESLANDMGVDAAFVFKRRIDGERTELTAMNAKVDGAKVLIYDDMIRTGGSLINAARAYKDAGAKSISAIATHGVLPGNAVQKIQDSGLLDNLVVCDTHPRTQTFETDFVKVYSVAKLWADFLNSRF